MVGGPHLCWAVLNYLLDEVAHFKAIISCKATNHKSVLMPLLDWTPWSKANLFVSIALSFKWFNITCLCLLAVCTSGETNLITRVCNMFLAILETSSVLPWLPHCTIHESYDGAKTRTFLPKSCGSQFWAQQLWGSLRCTQVLFQASLSPCLCRPWNKTTSKLVEQITSSGGHNWWTRWPWFTKGMHKMQMGH